jgi:gluconolactonase
VFFTANAGGALGMNDINHNSKGGKISLKEAEKALGAPGNNGTVQVKVTEVGCPPSQSRKFYIIIISLTCPILFK